jgi:ribosomal subunit interface protein
MQLQVSFRGIDASKNIEQAIEEKAAKLEKYHPRISRCEVMVESSTNRHQKGDLVHVRIHLTVPGGEIVVGRDPDNQAHADPLVSLRDAFDAAKRQLQTHSEKRRGD